MSDPFFYPSRRDIANPLQIPAYDTIVETPRGAAQTGGKLEFFQGGPEGEKVATLIITINADRRIIQRAS